MFVFVKKNRDQTPNIGVAAAAAIIRSIYKMNTRTNAHKRFVHDQYQRHHRQQQQQ